MPHRLEWYVVYTTPGGERLAKEDLEALGFQAFMPIVREWKPTPEHKRRAAARHGKTLPKRKLVEVILFPRYLFVGLLPIWRDFAGLRRSKRVQEILCDPFSSPVRLPFKEVEGLMDACERGRFEDAAARAVRFAAMLHMRVDLMAGPFAGYSGEVVRAGKAGIRINVKGGNGATFHLDIPMAELARSKVFKVQDDQQKQSALVSVG